MNKESFKIVDLRAERERRNSFAIPCPPPGSLVFSKTWPSKVFSFPRVIGPFRYLRPWAY